MHLIVAFMLLGTATAAHADDAASSFQNRVLPVLEAHCTRCHGGEKPRAKLDLKGPRPLEQLRSQERHWFQVLERIEAGTMPPEDSKPLTEAEKKAVASWVRGEFTSLLVAQQRQEGRSKLRRLSRNEYANTILDLVGVRPATSRAMPADGRVDGYDKVSAALPFSTAGTDGAMKIAEDVVTSLFAAPPMGKSPPGQFRLWAGPSEQSKGHILELPDGTMVSFNTDTTSGPLRLKNPEGKLIGGGGTRVPGMHKLRLSVYAYQTDKPLLFGIYAGHTGAYPQIIELLKVLEAPPGKPTIIETEVNFRTRLTNDLVGINDGFRLIPFGLGVQVPKNTQASDCKGPGLAVQWVDIEEPDPPAGAEWLLQDLPPAIHDLFLKPSVTLKTTKVSRAEFAEAMRSTLRLLGTRLYRRDLSDSEADRLAKSYMVRVESGMPLRTALIEEVVSLISSPDFLCRIEPAGKLPGFALASRLSYFLWNSTPDEQLLDLARQGKLADSAVLREQTERMLKDPKSQRFVADFTDQWLGLWGIDNTTPDRDLYPEFDEPLKYSSLLETRASFREMLEKNLSVRDFVAPDWAIVNNRLATLYGIPGVEGFAMRRVSLPADSPYGGLWTQAAVLKVTANGTLTSPVKRGVWVAERLLGVAVPPPPPNIDPVDPDTRGAKTLREQLELHRGKGSCAACHAKFDPYGFALESFDVMGAFRTRYRIADPDAGKRKGTLRWKEGLPVDASGVTPQGEAFSNVKQLRQMLAKDPAALARGVTRHLLTYATGEPTSPMDQATLDAIVTQAASEKFGLRSLVHGVIQSDLFRSK
jgi:mono/diheme cytochrome c family protein